MVFKTNGGRKAKLSKRVLLQLVVTSFWGPQLGKDVTASSLKKDPHDPDGVKVKHLLFPICHYFILFRFFFLILKCSKTSSVIPTGCVIYHGVSRPLVWRNHTCREIPQIRRLANQIHPAPWTEAFWGPTAAGATNVLEIKDDQGHINKKTINKGTHKQKQSFVSLKTLSCEMCVSGHNFQKDFEEIFGGQFGNVNAHGLYMTFKGWLPSPRTFKSTLLHHFLK